MTYHEALLQAIDGGNADPIEDEWLFEKFRAQFVNSMPALEAFESIAGTLDLLLGELDESTAIEILQTIIALARKSDTTELPPKLIENRFLLEDQFFIFGDYAKNVLNELFRYYRLK